MFKCCGESFKGKFIYRIQKPFYRCLEFGICPKCGTKHFIDYKQVLETDDSFTEKVKDFTGNAAQKEYNKWQQRLNNTTQGTFSKQFFNYGTFQRTKNGYFKTKIPLY